jgi:predicted metal-dependent phosphoesterase TrpH
MGKADLHVHTAFSDGIATAQEVLEWTEERTDIDVLAITDHDSIEGAWQAREQWAKGRYRFEVVVGAEVTCIEGHLLALFLEDPVPNMRWLPETLEAIQRLGGIAVVPHPMNPLTRSLGIKELRRSAAASGGALHGIETANCSPGSGLRRARVLTLNRTEWRLAEVGGSDAHFPDFIGGAYTSFEGKTAAELKAAILARDTEARTGIRPGLRQIGARRLAQQSWRGFMTTPRRMGWGPTVRSFVKRTFHSR